MKLFGQKVKKYRKDWKLTIEELAKKSGCSKSYLWEIENNPSLKPSVEIAYRIARSLKLDLNRLLDDNISINEAESDPATNLKFQIECIKCEKTLSLIQSYVDLLIEEQPFRSPD